MNQINLFLSQCRKHIKPDAWFNKKFLLIFLFVLMATLNLLGQASKVWDYPVHYGTQEWAELKTFEERLNVLNVPDSLLQIMRKKIMQKKNMHCTTFQQLAWFLEGYLNKVKL